MTLKKNVLVGIFFILCGMSLTSCSKAYRKVTVDRDCTGTYIKVNNNDFYVCNPSIISSFSEGSEIEVKFNSKSNCPQDPNLVICEMYHVNSGIVEITEIK